MGSKNAPHVPINGGKYREVKKVHRCFVKGRPFLGLEQGWQRVGGLYGAQSLLGIIAWPLHVGVGWKEE